jgi:PleD family two-component response regulator
VSLGINDLDSEIDNSSTWLSGADKALYVAKQEGRNKSIIHK